jgi:hypothetical protein
VTYSIKLTINVKGLSSVPYDMATITIKINEEIFHFQIDIFAKAKQMNFYHDINTGTLINVKAHRKGTF